MHTFEYANAKMQELGNSIVESTFKSWSKPCTIIFMDGSKSTKHQPCIVDRDKLKSKPKTKLLKHTFESANAKMQKLGNRIVKSTYDGWQKPCTIIFDDGSKSTEHSPFDADSRGMKSKPRVGEYTFESASEAMKELGNKIVESTWDTWGKPCTIIFSDGTVSDKHIPWVVYTNKYKTKPGKRGRVPHTFESASEELKHQGKIVKGTFKGWEKLCKFTFIDGTTSSKHTPRQIHNKNYKTKPRKVGGLSHTFESANNEVGKFGNKIVESTFKGWMKLCTIIFSDKTKSTRYSPFTVVNRCIMSKPEFNGFDVNKPGYIYFFAYKVYGKTVSYKIGITNNNITNRFTNVNLKLKDKSKGSLKHCDVLFYFSDGRKCLEVETTLKRKFERVVIDNVVSGKDEMFSEEGALHAYIFVKMLKCCKEINGKSKRPEVQRLVKHIADNCK